MYKYILLVTEKKKENANLIHIDSLAPQIRFSLLDLGHQFGVCVRGVAERQHPPAEAEEEPGAEGDEEPKGDLDNDGVY